MVMIFQVQEARDQLLKEGIVCTFRKKQHKEGKDWATDKRCGKKIADITIEKLFVVECPEDLRNYADQSGFKSAVEWWVRIQQKYGKDPLPGYLYKVTRLGACAQ
jgi:hypothetical protein